jgi:hypothetical protein
MGANKNWLTFHAQVKLTRIAAPRSVWSAVCIHTVDFHSNLQMKVTALIEHLLGLSQSTGSMIGSLTQTSTDWTILSVTKMINNNDCIYTMMYVLSFSVSLSNSYFHHIC